jgi:hypothetical protein
LLLRLAARVRLAPCNCRPQPPQGRRLQVSR